MPNQEFSNGHQLLLCKALLAVVDTTRLVCKACNFKKFDVMFDIRAAIQTLLVKFELIYHWSFLLPDALVEVGRFFHARLEHRHTLLRFSITTLHYTLKEVLSGRAVLLYIITTTKQTTIKVSGSVEVCSCVNFGTGCSSSRAG